MKKKNQIDYYRSLHGFTVQQLADMVGISRVYLSDLKSGKKRLNQDIIEKLAKALGCTASDILKESPTPNAHIISNSSGEFIDIPIYDAVASAGGGAWNQDIAEITGHISYNKAQLKNLTSSAINQLANIKVAGDSMEPTINEGDIVLVDMNAITPISGKIYVLEEAAALYVKRLFVEGGTVIVRSDNPRHKQYPLSGDTRIIGRAISQMRDL